MIKGCSKEDETLCVYSHGFEECPNNKCWLKIHHEQMEEEMAQQEEEMEYGYYD